MTCSKISLSPTNEFLVDPTAAELESFSKSLSREIGEKGETLVTIGNDESTGLTPDDLEKAYNVLTEVAHGLGCDVSLVRSKPVEKTIFEIREYLVRLQLANENKFTEVRVAVIGNVDAGKSTLLGVLTHCALDNGRGSARQRLLRHKHEKETGRTSSVGNQIIGFDSVGNITNQPTHGTQINWSRICTESSKIINFYDLAGHEKYFKTTVFGLMGNAPDFCLLVVGSNAGVNGMAREHLGLAIALNLPVLCVVTKIDQTSPNIVKETLSGLGKLLKSNGIRKIPLLVQEDKHAVIAAQNFASERVAPIFKVSSVTGEGLDKLKMFLNLIQPKETVESSEIKTEFVIEETFTVVGVGTVVSGILTTGKLRAGDILNLGPDAVGNFRPVTVKSIERKHLPIRELEAGQSAALALKKVKKCEVRKGSVLISTNETGPKEACYRFKGTVVILHHPTTIRKNYQAVIHVGAVRQSAKIVSMAETHLRTGDRAEVTMEFMKRPEWIHVGQKFIFREGRTKAIGTITERIPLTTAKTKSTRNKMEVG